MSQFNDTNEDMALERIYPAMAIGIFVALIALRFLPNQEWLKIASALYIILSIAVIIIVSIFNRNSKQAEDVHSEEIGTIVTSTQRPQTKTEQNMSIFPSLDMLGNDPEEQRPGFSIHTMVQTALESMQCQYDTIQENDTLTRYVFNYQDGLFDAQVEDDAMCRIIFPYCYDIPLADYELGMRMAIGVSYAWKVLKIWCGKAMIEEGGEERTRFIIYADIPLFNDPQSFVGIFRTVVQACFRCQSWLNTEYTNAKRDQLLEAVDISEVIKSAKPKK